MHSFVLENITLADTDSVDNKLKDAVSGRGIISKIYRLLCWIFSNCSVSIKAQ